MKAATASFRSSRPLNGSQLFASSSPIAARVASIASAGGGMSVSRFSSRRTSGSSPAAAATRSILNPGMASRRVPTTAIVAVALLVALAEPAVAHAHVRSSVIAVDYRVRVLAQPAGVSAGVYLSDHAVRLDVRPGHELVVVGYQGEPFL